LVYGLLFILKGRNYLEDLGIDGRADNINIDLKEIWCEGVDWIQLDQKT